MIVILHLATWLPVGPSKFIPPLLDLFAEIKAVHHSGLAPRRGVKNRLVERFGTLSRVESRVESRLLNAYFTCRRLSSSDILPNRHRKLILFLYIRTRNVSSIRWGGQCRGGRRIQT